jgi:hypothetical protein
MRICAALLALAACGSPSSAPPRRDAAAAVPAGSAAMELPARPLGLDQLAEFGWHARSGQPAFRAAQAAEQAGNWPAVVRACTEALAADSRHLDAAWLLAIAYAKTGALDHVTEPLALAGAGDYGKWAVASLVHPALGEYLATPAGVAWRHRVEADRARYLAALARAVVIRAAGELYAYDVASPRWYRLTRTNGHVIAALRVGNRLAYVTQARTRFGVGAIDLDDGHSTHAVPISNGPLAIVGEPQGFWISRGPIAHTLALDGTLTTVQAPQRPSGPTLTISVGGTARLARLPIASVTADWDDQSLASAIRIGTTNHVISVASPGLIAGNTLAWSPDRSNIAFVAQLADQCVAHAGTMQGRASPATVAAVVADAATGTIHELARATSGLAVEWVNDRELAVASDTGVTLVPLGSGAPTALPGASGLVTPMFTARCTQAPLPDIAEGSDDEE